MKQQRLGFVGLGDDTASACLSMLKIMDGRSGFSWVHSDPDSADVLMVANDNSPETRRWIDSGKPRIIVYRCNDQKPASPYVLQHPFRVMQLMGVLEDVAGLLERQKNQAAPLPATPQIEDQDFWSSLNRVVHESPETGSQVYVARSDAGCLWLDPQARRFYANPILLKAMIAGEAMPGPLQQSDGRMDEQAVACSLFSVCWMLTPYLQGGLPAWIDADGAFQLARWPSFGSLAKSRADLSLCALLTKRPLTREQLQTLSQAEMAEIDRFINACAMSGLMRYDKVTPAPLPPLHGETDKKGFGGLIKGLRSRLGLSA